MNFLNVVVMTENWAQTRSDKDIYHSHSTKLRIKDIKQLDNGKLLITTGRIFENFSILVDLWVEIIFEFEYDVEHEEAKELLDHLGYNDFKHVSVSDFMSIKTKGKKMYGFTASKALKIRGTNKRKLDLTDFDDVNTIWKLYYAKVSKYQNMISDIKYFTTFVELDKDKYESDLRDMNKYQKLRDELLQNMTSDEDSSSLENAEKIDN